MGTVYKEREKKKTVLWDGQIFYSVPKSKTWLD